MSKDNSTFDVEIHHAFKATAERVYDAWLDPVLIQQWFGPGLGQTLPVELDAWVGGGFRIVQVRNGDAVRHFGTYLALERPTHLAFTWATEDDEGDDEVNVYISAEGRGAAARLIHTVDVRWQDDGDAIREAWSAMLQAMDDALSG